MTDRSINWRRSHARARGLGLLLLLCAIFISSSHLTAAQLAPVDTALVISVDVSSSVDDRRYKLQMEGIAAALEDESVMDAILNGPRGGVLFSLVVWSDRPQLAVPWVRVGSKDQAMALAQTVRSLPRYGGQFTCMGRMLRFLTDKVLAQVPAKTFRTVVDVSGDGKDNCNPPEPIPTTRDELAGYGTTINGLPILEGDEAETLQQWYRENVRGGPAGFILPAEGFEDFGRAIRQKFVVEISGRSPLKPDLKRTKNTLRGSGKKANLAKTKKVARHP